VLALRSVVSGYGGIVALKGVSLHVAPGEIVALVGANGAGKTTILNTIFGMLRPRSGAVVFQGTDISGYPPERAVELGIAHVPQGRQLFWTMTVLENLLLGTCRRARSEKKRGTADDLARVYEIFPILKERSKQLAGTLSGGEQQMLAVARALMSRPKLLLLDEPSMGLAPLVSKQIFKVIANLRKQGTTMLLVEQNAKAAFSIAQRGYVLETGSLVLEGTAGELAHNTEIQRAYLGKGYKQVFEEEGLD